MRADPTKPRIGRLAPPLVTLVVVAAGVSIGSSSSLPSSPSASAGLELALPVAQPTGPEAFAVEPWMRPTVDFWKRIYTEYTSAQGLIHDSKYPGLIYEIVDASHIDDDGRRELVRRSKEKWGAILRSVHAKRTRLHEMSAEELRVYKLFAPIEERDKFLDAAEGNRIRFQLGLKDKFAAALVRSARYLPEMERIFEEQGLPGELTRLPFVESSFELFALSRAGAAGIWQFIPSTGKRFLRIDPLVDERFDPIRSTRAAAELLKFNYQLLKTWPLAITAYNHGHSGLARVVEAMGTTDFKTLVENYRGPTFGIASRNYYLSFLAALEVERSQAHYFGELAREKPEPTIEVKLMDYVALADLSRGLGLSEGAIREHNPALGEGILKGTRRLPAGFPLRLPEAWGQDVGGARSAFWLGYGRIPESLRHKAQIRGNL